MQEDKQEGKESQSRITQPIDYSTQLISIQKRVLTDKIFQQEDQQVIHQVISKRNLNLRSRIFAMQILEDAQHIKGRQILYPDLKKIADNYMDPLSTRAYQMILDNKNIPVDLSEIQKSHQKIVSKEVQEVTQKSQFRQNILEQNLMQTIEVNQNNEIQNSKNKEKQLLDTPNEGDHTK